MKKVMLLLLVLVACGPDPEPSVTSDELIGFWVTESATVNGKDSTPFANNLLTGNYLHFQNASQIGRCYQFGTWSLAEKTIKVNWEPLGQQEEFKIISKDNHYLVLEHIMLPKDYINVEAFMNEFGSESQLTIRQTYRFNQ